MGKRKVQRKRPKSLTKVGKAKAEQGRIENKKITQPVEQKFMMLYRLRTECQRCGRRYFATLQSYSRPKIGQQIQKKCNNPACINEQLRIVAVIGTLS